MVEPALPPAPPPPPDPCAGFKDDIDHLRCEWVTGPERSEFVPPAGENAPLAVQVECLPLREQPQAYALCIARGHV